MNHDPLLDVGGAIEPRTPHLTLCRRPPKSLDLSVADVVTLLSVHRLGSLSAAARFHRVTAGQVSKAIARLEHHLERKLLERNVRGALLSPDGAALLPALEAIVAQVNALLKERAGPAVLTVAGLSSVLDVFALDLELPMLRPRYLAMTSSTMRGLAHASIVDIAITVGAEPLPAPWSATAIGPTRRSVFGSPSLVRRLAGTRLNEAALTDVPFVRLVRVVNGQVEYEDDGCPMEGRRRIGHEVEMLALGFELASRSEQLVFGPHIAAAKYCDSGRLVELAIDEWQGLPDETVYLHVHGDRVLRSVAESVTEHCRAVLARHA